MPLILLVIVILLKTRLYANNIIVFSLSSAFFSSFAFSSTFVSDNVLHIVFMTRSLDSLSGRSIFLVLSNVANISNYIDVSGFWETYMWWWTSVSIIIRLENVSGGGRFLIRIASFILRYFYIESIFDGSILLMIASTSSGSFLMTISLSTNFSQNHVSCASFSLIFAITFIAKADNWLSYFKYSSITCKKVWYIFFYIRFALINAEKRSAVIISSFSG